MVATHTPKGRGITNFVIPVWYARCVSVHIDNIRQLWAANTTNQIQQALVFDIWAPILNNQTSGVDFLTVHSASIFVREPAVCMGL